MSEKSNRIFEVPLKYEDTSALTASAQPSIESEIR